MQLQVGRIQVGAQGTLVAVLLAGLAGYGIGQFIKTGKRPVMGKGGTLSS